MLMRGGTSKGAYFLSEDLPSDPEARNRLLLGVMGSPDPRQIDGIGGAHPLTSKVAIVERSKLPNVDIDFLFAQVSVEKDLVDTTPNCGNILAGIGPFAIERGLIAAKEPTTTVRVRTINTGTIAELTVPTPNGHVTYEGDEHIDGVPGTAAAITINFLDTAGSVCGSLLPTGHSVDIIDGIQVTCIDNGMPVVVMKADAVACKGNETVATLDANAKLKERIEAVRLKAGLLMGMGDVAKAVVPKIALVSAPRAGGAICTRSFIPHKCHESIGVFAGVSVATACILPGTPANAVAVLPPGSVKRLAIEHPTGEFAVRIELGGTADAPTVGRAGLVRTARALFDGKVFVRANAVSRAMDAVSALGQSR